MVAHKEHRIDKQKPLNLLGPLCIRSVAFRRVMQASLVWTLSGAYCVLCCALSSDTLLAAAWYGGGRSESVARVDRWGWSERKGGGSWDTTSL